ncbi:MAG: SGNH/GDSL hydrolase family protein [Acidobacteriota bacterium]|nr:SGNH/GDSL hydrolase family protein [Acidobacteriota bacterium]
MSRLPISIGLLGFALLVSAGAATAVNTGSADFTNYVALGDSLTAGFTSDSLIDASQRASYPALIFAATHDGATAGFELPLVSAPGIPGILHLVNLVPSPTIAPTPGLGRPENLQLPRPYNDLAVPGENLHTMINTVTDHGGLHDLILRGLGTQLQEGIAEQPTFVTLWIGNNDALAAATSGIVIDGVTLTTLAQFQADFTTIVGAITTHTHAKLAIANIPRVTSIPFVTTIPPVLVNPRTNQPVIVNGQPVPLLGPNGPLQPGDRVLLTAQGFLGKGFGIPVALGGNGLPLPKTAVLYAAEVQKINDRVAGFNSIIQTVAGQAGAAYVDVNSLLDTLASTGIDVGGITFNANFLTGGVFSYDGVHPTSFGYAYIANAFISAINDKYGAAIPPADLGAAIFNPSGGTVPVSAGAATKALLTDDALRTLFWAMSWPTTLPEGGTPAPPPRHGHHHHRHG